MQKSAQTRAKVHNDSCKSLEAHASSDNWQYVKSIWRAMIDADPAGWSAKINAYLIHIPSPIASPQANLNAYVGVSGDESERKNAFSGKAHWKRGGSAPRAGRKWAARLYP